MNENELVAKLDRIEQQLTNLNRDVAMTIESGKVRTSPYRRFEARHLLDTWNERDRRRHFRVSADVGAAACVV